MTNETERTQIFDLLPAEEFFSRNSEVQKLFQVALEVQRPLLESCFLTGSRKSGKTEVLKRVYTRLFWEQDVVVPFFHPTPVYLHSARGFCREYFFRAVLQFLAFLTKDPKLARADEFDVSRAVQLAHTTQHTWLVEAINRFEACTRGQDLQAVSRAALEFPGTASTRAGLRAFVILDDFHRINLLPSAEDIGLVAASALAASQNRHAPHLFSGSLKKFLRSTLRTVDLPAGLDILLLQPLQPTEAQTLLERLCLRFEVSCPSDLFSPIVRQLDQNPFYLQTLIRAARRESKGLASIKDFADLYTQELTQGNLNFYFNHLLGSTRLDSLETVKALQVLKLCVEEPPGRSILCDFKNREGLEELDVDRIINALDEVDLINYELGSVSSTQDGVLRDWVEWNFNQKIKGTSLNQACHKIAADILTRFSRSIHLRQYNDTMGKIRELLRSMGSQTVPSLLFDYERFSAEQTDNNLEKGPKVVLPEMISVDASTSTSTSTSDFTDRILVARGFRDKGSAEETAWLVGYCSTAEAAGLKEIERFYQKCQQTIQLENLRSARYWLLAENRFNQAASSFAAQYQIQTSNCVQLDHLCRLVLKVPPDLKSNADPKDLMLYEMILPFASDAELVAVRAFEQIAENTEFDQKSKGQVRMALIEACINARETASSQAERIRLRFHAASDRVVIHLRYELSARPQISAAEGPTRTWSVNRLEALMDEVNLVHTYEGLELVMTKYRRLVKKEAV